MNGHQERDIARRLASMETAPPPPELLERLKAEIPENLGGAANDDEAPEAVPATAHPGRKPWLVAASVAVVVLGAFLGLRVYQQAPLSSASEEDAMAASSRQAPEIAEGKEAPAVADRDRAQHSLQDQDSSLAQGSPPPVAEDNRQAAGSSESEPAERRASARGSGEVPAPLPPSFDLLFEPGSESRPGSNAGKEKAEAELTSNLPPEDGESRASAKKTPMPAPAPGDEVAGAMVFEDDIYVTGEAPQVQQTTIVSGQVSAEYAPPSAPEGSEDRQQEVRSRRSDFAVGFEAVPMTEGSSGSAGRIFRQREGEESPKPSAEAEPVNRRLDELLIAPPPPAPAPSTGGTAEPNDQPYGDVFFRHEGTNPFVDTEDDRLSTFGLDVDTGSWGILRRYVGDGNLPPAGVLRVEEVINAFDYGDEPPRRRGRDFALTAEGAATPFSEGERYHLLRFAIRGREVSAEDRKPAVLTFVVDVSGSMNRENRLGLVRQSLGLLVDELTPEDKIGLVIFGNRGEVILEPTSNHANIRRAVDALRPGGSTNAEEGLVLGYRLASRYFREGGINRVILCSDGVANVGRTGPESILSVIKTEAERGIELTTLGFGMGNYNDALMERLADEGDGRYAYLDDLDEARRVLVEDLTGTLQTIASEARAQVEFNPETVSRYRLLGYENRDVADDRFRDDTVDAGEIGAGHAVTALYEVKLMAEAEPRAELATLHLRYRSEETGRFEEVSEKVTVREVQGSWESASPALRLSSLVAETAEILKGTYWAREGSLDDVLRRLQQLAPSYAGDERVAELTALVARAARLVRDRDPRAGNRREAPEGVTNGNR